MPTPPPISTSADGGPPWPESYPVESVETTMGITIKDVDQAEYTDLRRQGLIKFSDASAPSTSDTGTQE